MRPKPREEGRGERRAGWRERLCVAMSLVLALSSVPTAGLAEAAGDFWSPDGIEYVEVCQDFGHYAARKSLPSSILLLKSAITSAGCLYPCGRRRS